jgi:hypothetical protein
MKKFIAVLTFVLFAGNAFAVYVYRDGNGVLQTFNDFACFTTQHCSAQVITDSTGTEKATSANPLITASPANITPSSCSVALTTGGTAQNIIAASSSLNGFTIANIDALTGSGEPIWVSFVGTAQSGTLDSFPLTAPSTPSFAGMSSYTTPANFRTNHAVSVVAATNGHRVSCVQW